MFMNVFNKIKIIVIIIFLVTPLVVEAQWKEVTTIPAPFTGVLYLDIFFLDDNPAYGWACGFGGNVIRTTDGGDTWQGTKIKGMHIDTIDDGTGNIYYDTTYVQAVNQLESIHFADELTGYTSGEDMIFKSTDGGENWFSVYDTNMYIWGNFFLTPDIGWAVGGGCYSDQHFHKTTNGGKTWYTFVGEVDYTGLSDVIMESVDGIGYASSSGKIWKTTNGGITWFIFSNTGNIDWQEEITHYGNTFLVPFDKGCTGGEAPKMGGLRMSTNNGLSWREFTINTSMFGAFLLDSLRGWGCGNQNSVYYTSDGGITWELNDCGIPYNAPLDDIWFVNDTLGWVVGRGVFKYHIYDTLYSKILADGDSMICLGDSITLYSSNTFNYYLWSTGDTTRSIVVDTPGVYKLWSYNHECETVYPDSFKVELYPGTDIWIHYYKSLEICEGDSVILWVDNRYTDIIWSTLEEKDSIVVKKSGIYYVTITDTNGCENSNYVEVIVHPLPEPLIQNMGRLTFCIGDSVKLRTSEEYLSYYWFEQRKPENKLSDEREITVMQSGIYHVIVTSNFGCIDTSDGVKVEVLDLENSLRIFSNNKVEGLDFDSIGLTKTQCQPLYLQNMSNLTMIINDIFVVRNIEFSIPQSQYPIYILPGDTVSLIVCFRPLKFNERRDTLIISDTCSNHFVPLFGYGTDNLYEGESDCEVKLKFKTLDIISGKYFRIENVYPNPAEEMINIEFTAGKYEQDQQLSWILRNSFGRKISEGNIKNSEILSGSISDNKLTIKTDNLSAGLYILNLSNGIIFYNIPVLIVK
jgi:photosystem II stability/assembly factor-like uncharacterized protein